MITIDTIISTITEINASFLEHHHVIPRLVWGIEDNEHIVEIIRAHCAPGKKNVIFVVTDSCEPLIDLGGDDIIIFRTSMYRSTRLPCEHILPYFWECSDEIFPPLKKHEKPIIGFCGQNSCPERAELIDHFGRATGRYKTNFIIRSQFWGGNPGDKRLIEEYNDNIRQSHFTIASRGAGNFSMRFYQVLAAGRIPILIDSDLLLPFEDIIDWSRYIVIGKNAQEVSDKIDQIWTHDDIIRRQVECGRLFKEYLCCKSFLRTWLHVHVSE